ncbi:unnamed protein product [Gordionus sp. m RMFG-2023]|uniref:uncharacterized protein LOC135930407 n=1 Tax=Gordionus sp. m RMFG-2023 TaxID=3053472 RepID=UPI0030E30B3C
MLDENLYYPEPHVIKDLYEKLSKNETLELKWKNPGRHLPSLIEKSQKKVNIKCKNRKKSKNTETTVKPKDFDFVIENKDDDILKGPLKKENIISTDNKIVGLANFDDVIKGVLKHKLWEKDDLKDI